MTKKTFSHIENFLPGMVDISHKEASEREAVAEAILKISPELNQALIESNFMTKKGPIKHTAIIAATMAVKNTHNIIPLCHPLSISSVKINIEDPVDNNIVIRCAVKTFGATGVEMEALFGASTAALTLYDMCKSMSTDMSISQVVLIKKSGGRSG